MFEVERKRKIPDGHADRVVTRLTRAGYKSSQPITETDAYFSRPDVDYMKTVECLRVRRRDNFAEITYKPPTTPKTSHSGITSKREVNVILKDENDAVSTLELLEAIGMVRLAEVVKARRVFRNPAHADVSITLDEIEGIGTFVEVEILSPSKTEAQERLAKIERTVGVENYEIATKPYRDLVMDISSHQQPVGS